MEFKKVQTKVISKTKGAFCPIVWEKPLPTLKAYTTQVITKRSFAVVRFGIEYDNQKAVQEKRATGELPEVNQGLPWGTWLKYPYFITHKSQNYLRCSTSKTNKVKSEYYLNGLKVSADVVKPMCQKSAFPATKDDKDVFVLNIDNIISIG